MNDTAYKLAHINKKLIKSAARKALIAADPGYYAWTPDDQERFRANLDAHTGKKIRKVLLDCLLGIKCPGDDVDRVWDGIPLSKLNALNWAKLLTSGIGEDYIYLNESLAEGKSLLDFTTLYDYDHDDHLFQEQANRRDFPEYKGCEYFACRHPSWVRLLIDDQFYYGTLSSLATFLVDEIDSTGVEYINELIPHEYVHGKEHGKREAGGFLWDLKIDAAGREAHLDELKSRWYANQRERWLELSRQFSAMPPAVYIQDRDWDDDPHRFFIFRNEETLKTIRWRRFLSDCQPLMADISVVTKLTVREIDRSKSWLNDSYADIMKNFNPDIVKFRKKKKIIMTVQAMKDLDDINS